MIILLFILILIFIKVGYADMVIQKYHIKANVDHSIKIAVISDLHGTKYGYRQEKLIQKIKDQNVDFIILAGDIFDERHSFNNAIDLLKGISDYPVFYALGNHEIYVDRIDEIYSIAAQYNIKMVGQGFHTLKVGNDFIDIYGIDDYKSFESMDDFKEQFDKLSNQVNDHYSILISHRPFLIDYYRSSSFELVVSGHAHGGQWRIPHLLNGLYAPDENMFPKYAGGKYSLGKTQLIVSRGLVKNIIPRFFNPPELVIIELEK